MIVQGNGQSVPSSAFKPQSKKGGGGRPGFHDALAKAAPGRADSMVFSSPNRPADSMVFSKSEPAVDARRPETEPAVMKTKGGDVQNTEATGTVTKAFAFAESNVAARMPRGYSWTENGWQPFSWVPEVSASVEAKLAELHMWAINADRTGMTPEQFGGEIWNQYNDALGGNLLTVLNFSTLSEDWTAIGTQLLNTLMDAMLGFRLSSGEICKVSSDQVLRGFMAARSETRESLHAGMGVHPDMGYDEIEAAIMERFEGKNTLMDFLNKTHALHSTGVLSNRMGVHVDSLFVLNMAWALTIQFGVPRSDLKELRTTLVIPNEKFNLMLNQPFDAVSFLDNVENIINAHIRELRGDEHLIAEGATVFQIPDLIDDFLAMMERHWARMNGERTESAESVLDSGEPDESAGDGLLPFMAGVAAKTGSSVQVDGEKSTEP